MNLFKLLCDHQELRDKYHELFSKVLNLSGCPSERMPVLAEMVIVQYEFRDVCEQLLPYKN